MEKPVPVSGFIYNRCAYIGKLYSRMIAAKEANSILRTFCIYKTWAVGNSARTFKEAFKFDDGRIL